MIEVDTSTALLLYLGLFLFMCLGVWFCSHLKQRNKQPLPPLYLLKKCEYCHYQYLGKNGEKITECPQCQSLNKNE